MGLHESGFYKTDEFGMITNKEKSFFANNICVIVDVDTGTLLKIGDRDTSNIANHYQAMTKKYCDAGLDKYADTLTFIEFDRYSDVLDIDGICTIINYLNNCIGGQKVQELLSMSNEQLTEKVKYLQEIGF